MLNTGKIISRTRTGLNNFQRDLYWQSGISRSSFENSKGARIILYHGICQKDPLSFNTLFITKKKFEQQLIFYKKHFQIISLNDFYLQRYDQNKFAVCLSFDDGFANNYRHVLPLLEQYQVPASFFITGIQHAGYDILWNDMLTIAGRFGPSKLEFRNEVYFRNTNKYFSATNKKTLNHILRESGFDAKAELISSFYELRKKADEDYWLQMSIDQIRELSQSRWVTIGSHSYYHNDLAEISQEELQHELLSSKKYLENITGKEIRALAFPYGSYSSQTVLEAKKAGYSQLLATDFDNESDANDTAMRERLTINPFISNVNQLYAVVRGHYY